LFQITKAFDGRQAYNSFLTANHPLNRHNYGIIFMDCDMPIIDGFVATKMIKQQILEEQYAKTIVIGYTALVDEMVLQKAKECSMDMVIAKPIS